MPPLRSTVQMLLAYANAICVALTVGMRSSFVGSPSASGRPAIAIAVIATTAHEMLMIFMQSSSKGGDGTIFPAMKRLRRALIVLGLSILAAYGAGALWLA